MWTLQKLQGGHWEPIRTGLPNADQARYHAKQDYRQGGRLSRDYGASYRVLDPEGRPYQETRDNQGMNIKPWSWCCPSPLDQTPEAAR